MFIAAPCTIAKAWKQPKCPSTDDWFKKMCHIYIYTHGTATATWVGLENIILSDVSQTEKDNYYMISHICGI